MKITAFGLIVFFVCMNVSLYVINETAILPYAKINPYEEPSGITGRLVSVDLSNGTLMIAGTGLVMAVIIGWATGNLLLGGMLGVILFGLSIFFPIVSWVVLGLPRFLAQMGVPLVIYTSLTALMSLIWFWFILSFIAQRQLED